MDLRTFLLQLSLTPGLPYKKQMIILNWLLAHSDISLPLSLATLCQLVEPSALQLEKIKRVYNSEQQRILMKQQFPFIALCDDEYPEYLKEIYEPPLIIYYQGDLRALQLPLVALVGARKATPYAYTVLKKILPPLQANGIGIVSGLAMGVDAIVHQTCLGQQAIPIGVIGTGLDVFYPASSRALQLQVGQNGLLLSEYPVGVGPKKYHFPARNRIIAGLCQTTVVIEAAKNSGSLITANIALQENRNVLAVPGPITAIMSVGCNELIANGAGCVLDGESILREMNII